MNNEDSVLKENELISEPELLPPPVKEKRSNFLILLLLSVAALCVLGIIVLKTINTLAPENYVFSTTSISTFHTSDGKTLFVFRDGKKTESVEVNNVICSSSCKHGYVEQYVNDSLATIDAYSTKVMCLNLNSTKLSVVTAKDGEKVISDNAKSAQMDESGNKVFYIDSNGVLNSYDTKNHKSVVIDTDVEACTDLSPSGKALIYKKENNTLFISTNGKAGKELDINGCYTVFSVTDDGKTVYYLEKVNNVFNISVYANGKTVILLPDIDPNKYFSAFLNKNNTEILLSYDSETYITYDRTSIKKIYDGNLVYPMKPEIASREHGVPFVRTYADTMITGSNSDGNFELLHITKDLTSEYVNGISSGVRITQDGERVYGLNADSLICVDISNGYKTETVATSVASFTMSYDGEDIYYTDTDGALWHVHNEKTKKIASACKEFYIDRDGTLFFTGAMGDGETLYYSRFGSSPKEIDFDKPIYSLFSLGGYAYFTAVEDDGTHSLFSVNRTECDKIADKIIY